MAQPGLSHAGATLKSRAMTRVRGLARPMLRSMGMQTRTWLALGALGALSIACGMSSESAFGLGDNGPNSSADGGSSSGSSGAGLADGGKAPESVSPDGIILVHAGASPSFRLCFAGNADIQPQPDATVMPAANVVGVEVGSAVRIAPLKNVPGKVKLYSVGLIKGLYSNGNKPTCADLAAQVSAELEINLGEIKEDLSRGLHILAVTGCPQNNGTIDRTAAQCGPDFVGTKANYSIRHIPIPPEGAAQAFRARVMNLSRPAESARGASSLDVAFTAPTEADAGDAGDGGADTKVATGVAYLEAPTSSVPLKVTSPDESYYANAKFTVTAGNKTLLTQTLADVQKLSQPDEVPSTYFSHASSYLMMLVGDPAPKLANGDADPDPLRNLHFLAIPVVDPASPSEPSSP